MSRLRVGWVSEYTVYRIPVGQVLSPSEGDGAQLNAFSLPFFCIQSNPNRTNSSFEELCEHWSCMYSHCQLVNYYMLLRSCSFPLLLSVLVLSDLLISGCHALLLFCKELNTINVSQSSYINSQTAVLSSILVYCTLKTPS